MSWKDSDFGSEEYEQVVCVMCRGESHIVDTDTLPVDADGYFMSLSLAGGRNAVDRGSQNAAMFGVQRAR